MSTQEWRKCYICGEPVLWQTNGIGWHPIQYHDCKPVPGARLEQAERERDELRAEVERLKKERDDEMGKAGEWIDLRTHRERIAAAVARITDRARRMEAERDAEKARADKATADRDRLEGMLARLRHQVGKIMPPRTDCDCSDCLFMRSIDAALAEVGK